MSSVRLSWASDLSFQERGQICVESEGIEGIDQLIAMYEKQIVGYVSYFLTGILLKDCCCELNLF